MSWIGGWRKFLAPVAAVFVLCAGMVFILPWLLVSRTQFVQDDVSLAKASPDGSYLAIGPSGNEPRELHLLNLRTRERKLIGRTMAPAWTVPVWSPDSRWLIYRDDEGLLRLFEPETWRSEPIGEGRAIGWSASGEWFAIRRSATGTFVGSVQQPDQLLPLFPPEVEPLAVSPDVGMSVGFRWTGKTVEMVAAKPNEPLQILEAGLKQVVAVSPDGTRQALVWPDGRLELADGEGRRYQTDVTVSSQQILMGWWSPDSEWLSLERRGTRGKSELLVLDAAGQIRFHSSRPFMNYYLDLDSGTWWSPDSRYFGFATYLGATEFTRARKVHVYDVETGRLRSRQLPGIGLKGLSGVQWIDERTVVGRSDFRLYHFRLR